MNDNKAWRFCAVGNIKKQHIENGEVFYGTKAFVGGAKVYICDATLGVNKGEISVLGLNRFRRYAVEGVPINLIENVRLQRIFKPGVLEVMDGLTAMDGWVWRGRTAEERRILKAFVENWNSNQTQQVTDVEF